MKINNELDNEHMYNTNNFKNRKVHRITITELAIGGCI